jgi:alpha-1,2-mannosyltransferase
MTESASLRLRPLVLGTSGCLILTYLVIAALMLTPGPDWRRNRMGNPLGHDFSQAWVAGQTAREGHAVEAYDIDRHAARQIEVFRQPETLYGWHYPPTFLALAALLAFLPYPLALLAFTLGSIALLLWALWRILPRWETLVVAAGTPILFQNVSYGQNGALTAALLALALTARGPGAGLWFSLLGYKPHLGLAVPAALAAGRRWRVIGMAVLGFLAQVALTSWWFGPEIWPVFITSLKPTAELLLNAPFGFAQSVSGFGALRLIGVGRDWASGFQTVLTLAVVAGLVWLWRGKADVSLKAAALLCAVPLSTPHALTYDLVVLIPAGAFLVRHGLATGVPLWMKLLLAALWALTAVSHQVAERFGVPVAFLGLVVTFTAILIRAVSELSVSVGDQMGAKPL